jgi:hypothetical protein
MRVTSYSIGEFSHRSSGVVKAAGFIMRKLNQDEAARPAKMRGKIGDILARRHEGLVEFFEMIGLKAPYAPEDAESLSEFLREACAFRVCSRSWHARRCRGARFAPSS